MNATGPHLPGTQAVSDDVLEVERKKNDHRRRESRNDQAHRILVIILWGIALMFLYFVATGVYIYTDAWFHPEKYKPETIQRIETVATHLGAVLGGYLASLYHQTVGRKE